jgi:magnesium transporter
LDNWVKYLNAGENKNLKINSLPKKKKNNRRQKTGLPPGTLIYTGEQQVENVIVSIISYNKETFVEKEIPSVNAMYDEINPEFTNWINIIGLHNESIVEKIGEYFNLNKLSLEDILSVGQRPKLDDFPDYLYLVLKMLTYNEENGQIEEEQVSFILLNNIVITFQERPGDVFDYIRKRLDAGKGTIRQRGADYLLYALLDSIIDNYFLILEKYGDKLEDMEIQLLENPEKDILQQLHNIRKETIQLRRSVYPLREVINKLEKLENIQIQAATKLFIRDLYDHTIQVIETVEIFRDTASGMSDLYMNSLSNKMNNVMKTLTIIATIFIPLTFIVGIYGMNFENMPELSYPWAYPTVMIFMLVISILMIFYFKKKRYL